jgi:DNA-binding CsgD family transcriptional regulator
MLLCKWDRFRRLQRTTTRRSRLESAAAMGGSTMTGQTDCSSTDGHLSRDTGVGPDTARSSASPAAPAGFLPSTLSAGQAGTATDPERGKLVERTRSHSGRRSSLSPREVEVVRLMCQGYTNAGIAKRICVSIKTVEVHVARIFEKLDVSQGRDTNRRVHAVIRWLEQPCQTLPPGSVHLVQ